MRNCANSSGDPVDLASQPQAIREQAAALLVEGFREPRGWASLGDARAEVARVLHEGFARAVVDDGVLLGWIGGCPHRGYDGNVWEVHPMVVRPDSRRRGIGRRLAEAFEHEAGIRGALTAFLGTDDDSGMTSLSDVNLYDDTPKHIAGVRDRGRGHPFEFYRRLGYVVVGVMPDANGPGRPDIYMAKRLRGRE
ncbi:MAG: GNAT family N-acetyltransferase [Phycisphaerales bacterium]|nr:MAG: GNAT family N-acetyltransferase [Phycisphaerales bacterium]